MRKKRIVQRVLRESFNFQDHDFNKEIITFNDRTLTIFEKNHLQKKTNKQMIVKVETFLVLNRSFFVHSLNYQFQFFIVIGTYGNCKAFVYKEIIIQKLFEYSFATTFSSKSDSSLSPICPKPCRVIGAKLIRA